MAKVRVKVLKVHSIGRIRPIGSEYLLDDRRVPFMVKQGYIEIVPKPKKRKKNGLQGTNGNSK